MVSIDRSQMKIPAFRLLLPHTHPVLWRRAGFVLVSLVSMISPLRSQTPDPKTVDIPPVKSSITVTEQIASEVPATITVLDRKEIEEQPGMNLDDRLRAVPGFSL